VNNPFSFFFPTVPRRGIDLVAPPLFAHETLDYPYCLGATLISIKGSSFLLTRPKDRCGSPPPGPAPLFRVRELFRCLGLFTIWPVFPSYELEGLVRVLRRALFPTTSSSNGPFFPFPPPRVVLRVHGLVISLPTRWIEPGKVSRLNFFSTRGDIRKAFPYYPAGLVEVSFPVICWNGFSPAGFVWCFGSPL